MAAVLGLTFRVRVRVSRDVVAISASGPFGFREVAVSQIRAVEQVPWGVMREIGVRCLGPGSWAYVTGSGDQAHLTLLDGHQVTVSAENFAEYAASLESARNPQATRPPGHLQRPRLSELVTKAFRILRQNPDDPRPVTRVMRTHVIGGLVLDMYGV